MLPPDTSFPGLSLLGENCALESLSLMQELASLEADGKEVVLPAAPFLGHASFPNLSMVAELTEDPLLKFLIEAQPPAEQVDQKLPDVLEGLARLGYPADAPAIRFIQEAHSAKQLEECKKWEEKYPPSESIQKDPDVLEGLARLGYPACAPALQQLQEAHSAKQLEESKKWEEMYPLKETPKAAPKPTETAVVAVHMQGPPAQALRSREDAIRQKEMEIAERERVLKEREEALSKQMNAVSKAGAGTRSASPQRPLAGVSGVLIDDEDLRDLYSTYDRDGSGFVSRTEFKQEYRSFENFGLPLTDKELDRIFAAFGGDDDKLSYEEFCILMLKRAKI